MRVPLLLQSLRLGAGRQKNFIGDFLTRSGIIIIFPAALPAEKTHSATDIYVGATGGIEKSFIRNFFRI